MNSGRLIKHGSDDLFETLCTKSEISCEDQILAAQSLVLVLIVRITCSGFESDDIFSFTPYIVLFLVILGSLTVNISR